ncbi:MAG: sigma-54-dependent Fis family transcriptional regulator [Burkholderiales bacterium]|nr:sigma-54-dependent Fis family transcriptional regulator [Burkholderiales bacterium]
MSTKPLPILIAEDDPALREALRDTLELAGYEVVEAIDGESALARLERTRVGMVVSDVQMKPMDGHRLLAEIKRRQPHLPVLLMTAYGMIDRAVEAMRVGACNYITKPFEPDVLVAQVVRHMLPAAWGEDGQVVADDPATREILDLVRRVAGTDATVLVTGESGTGKEVIARTLHRLSPRADGPFVAINCAAIPENLLESTLFGFEKGAFTGAANTTPGKFEQAEGGTLLLDEVSEMPLTLQAKLLRVLQEREVERVGGRRPIPVDIRVVATSNRDMVAEVRAGKFREDLYSRLNVFPLHNPPLRSRPADIVPLARRVLGRGLAGTARSVHTLSPAAEAALTGYGWPGNIRELENVMQRAMILASGSVIEAEHLALPREPRDGFRGETAPASSLEAPGPVDMKSLERKHILDTLTQAKGVRRAAAERLGMSERTLRYKLQQYRAEGFAVPSGGGEEL